MGPIYGYLIKEKRKKIKVYHEIYMKYVVIGLESPNEPLLFSDTTLGNVCLNTYFRDFQVDFSPYVDSLILS